MNGDPDNLTITVDWPTDVDPPHIQDNIEVKIYGVKRTAEVVGLGTGHFKNSPLRVTFALPLEVDRWTEEDEEPFTPFGDDDDHMPASVRPEPEPPLPGLKRMGSEDYPPFPAHHKSCAKWRDGPLAECSCPEGWGKRTLSGPS